MPLIIDITKIYLIILFIYATIGMFIFGGILNTEFMDTFEELTGDEIDEETLIFNFNDMMNSFLFFFNMNNAGYVENINLLLVAYKSIEDSAFKFLLVKLFLYSFYFMTELAILNILIGFIGGFMETYLDTTDEDHEAAKLKASKMTFLDVITD